jgi:DNA-binding HxlR family transcriptional regulator
LDTIAPGIEKTCPTWQLLSQIGDKWTILIINILAEEPAAVRFGQLRKAVPGISQKMLTQTLRDLERNGLVVRVVCPVIPPHVEYSLTALGRTLVEPLRALSIWSRDHLAEVHSAQAAFTARESGTKVMNAARALVAQM